jgi:hypothetical protein
MGPDFAHISFSHPIPKVLHFFNIFCAFVCCLCVVLFLLMGAGIGGAPRGA